MKQTLKELRKSLKMTQDEFGSQFSVGSSTIVNAEKHGRITPELREQIEKKYKIELDFSEIHEKIENPSWVNQLVERLEADWKEEIQFLREQLKTKDQMIMTLMSEKLVKDEVLILPVSETNKKESEKEALVIDMDGNQKQSEIAKAA